MPTHLNDAGVTLFSHRVFAFAASRLLAARPLPPSQILPCYRNYILPQRPVPQF